MWISIDIIINLFYVIIDYSIFAYVVLVSLLILNLVFQLCFFECDTIGEIFSFKRLIQRVIFRIRWDKQQD